jgi:hypothetical protein
MNALAELCRLQEDWAGWDISESPAAAAGEEEGASSLSAFALRALLDALLPVIQQVCVPLARDATSPKS